MHTSDFPYYQPSFLEYNPVQSAVIPFICDDVNVVAAFATASGKTVLASCAFAYHLGTSTECRAVYVCPFRSLSEEKFREWKNDPQISKFGITISTGDHAVSMSEFMKSRLTIITAESFDSKMRNPSYRSWAESISCAVFDESHVLGDRNGAIETSLMRLTAVNQQTRVFLLSATLGNAMEIARWLKKLNGKPTKCFTSEWRPTKIKTEIHVVEDGHEAKIEEAAKLASVSVGKTIVFVHSKITGKEICQRLRKAGVRSAFHNASLSLGVRNKIEAAFSNQYSGLNVLVSTSTLGVGVNLG